MPDPISSSNVSQSNTGYDPSLDDDGQVCRSDVASSQQPPVASSSEPAVAQLVSSVAKPTVVTAPKSGPAPGASTAPSASTANNNAQRTSERHGIAPYADAGVIGARDAVYAGAALLKGRDPTSGHEAELLSASAQVGAQTELQVGIARAGASGRAGSVAVEAFTVRAHAGIHNDDGSTGVNLGFLATAAGVEATAGTVNSGTVGMAEGWGAAGSAGIRDLDHDGNHEICAKVSVDILTLGGCVEMPF